MLFTAFATFPGKYSVEFHSGLYRSQYHLPLEMFRHLSVMLEGSGPIYPHSVASAKTKPKAGSNGKSLQRYPAQQPGGLT